jgi:hypothetical protein
MPPETSAPPAQGRYYNGLVQQHQLHPYVYDNRGHRYFDGHAWRSMAIYGGYWGYWLGDMWYPVYPLYYYPYPGPTYYSYSYLPSGIRTGLKFDLDLIPKGERDLVKKGIVRVDGTEWGIVGRFEGFLNSALYLSPGTHEVGVMLEDGRQMETTVGIEPWHVTHLSLRFPADQPSPQPQLAPPFLPPQNKP